MAESMCSCESPSPFVMGPTHAKSCLMHASRRDETVMRQEAPYPTVLREIVETTAFRPGWRVNLYDDFDRGQGSRGMTLSIVTDTVNSYRPEEPMRVQHLFIVPAASYNRASWARWVFEQCALVDRHETMEFFEIDGEKVFAPNHGPGWDPYITLQLTHDIDRRTSFRGEVNP